MANEPLIYGAIGVAVALSIRAARWYLSRRERWEDDPSTYEDPARRTETLDDSTAASNPGGFELSDTRVRRYQPELFSDAAWAEHLKQYPITCSCTEHHAREWWLTFTRERIQNGDTRAAVVVSTSPLLVAAYSSDIDCVLLLKFDEAFVKDLDLKVGSRLIGVNTYLGDPNGEYAPDLVPGPTAGGVWHGFGSMIADFWSDDAEQLAEQKAQISEEEWKRCERLGKEALARTGGKVARDGRPLFVDKVNSWRAVEAA